MDDYLRYAKHIVALLIMGSATLLFSCKPASSPHYNPETLVTQRSDTLTMILSQNGLRRYRFETPLLERYELAREPFIEFTRGIFVETFKDSTEEIESTIIADYAIRYEDRARWEARGNVVASGVDGNTLYTEQLFWDEKTERIFSNVTSTIVQGEDVFVGERFISDDKLQNWMFLNYEGQVGFDPTPNEGGAEGDDPESAEGGPSPAETTTREATPAETLPEPKPEPEQRPEGLGPRRPERAPTPTVRPIRELPKNGAVARPQELQIMDMQETVTTKQ